MESSNDLRTSMKAFLCHSSVDKMYVDQVAKHLGREYILYAPYSFDHGETFKDEIRRALGRSNIFVFFISQNSLRSFWVDFELSEAEKRLFNHDITSAIGIRLEESIEFSDLPHWLQRTNVPYLESSAAAARLIRDHVNQLKRERRPDIFIGRSRDIARIEEALAPPSDHRPPGMVAIWGLPGIGRRAIARKALKDIWDFQRALPITVEAGDRLPELQLKLAAHLEAPRDSEAYIALRSKAEAASLGQSVAECIRLFEMAQAARELVVLVDQGGMLDYEGELISGFRELLLDIFRTQDLRTLIVSRRRPAPLELEPGLIFPNVRIDHLTDQSTRILIQQLHTRDQITLNASEVTTLVERVRGYPPAAYYAIGLIKDYGKEIILRDAKIVINFRETAFLRLLETEGKFTDGQRGILGLLPNFDSLPLPVLGQVLKIDQDTIDRDAMKLLDMALLSIDDSGFYSVSDPVREISNRIFGKLIAPYERLAQALDDYLAQRRADDEDQVVPLSLLRAQFKAYVLAGRSRRNLFYVASDLTRLQQIFYHEQEFERSIEFGRQALEIRPNEPNALRYLARALTQLERYPEAIEVIEEVKKGSFRDAKFLEGFLFRKQGNTDRAVVAYQEAIAHGMRGVAVHRELGQCLFEEGRLEEARTHLRQAHEADPDNKFVLDYEIQVAIAEGRFNDAKASLRQLYSVEEEMRYYHRLSTVEFAMRNLEQAYEAAAHAVMSSDRPHFEVIVQYVKTAIRSGNLQSAQAGLEMLSSRFPRIRNDIRNGLWARYYLAKGEVKDAEMSWRKISRKDAEISRRIREDILETMLRNHAVPAGGRTELQAELDELRKHERIETVDVLEADLT